MISIYRTLLIAFLLLLLGCEIEPASVENPDVWLIPKLAVYEGAGRDEIASIDQPAFTTTSATDFLKDEDLVAVLQVSDEVRAYPHPILDYHEIVNDEMGDLPLAINYCPFTGTGMAWERRINGETTTFGVSGLLYHSNLMPFDRTTATIWSQLSLKAINGPLLGQPVRMHSLIDMPWKTWKELFPNGKVLSKNTGFPLVYGDYPYLDFRTNNDFFIFPVTPVDKRLPNKERVLAIIGSNEARVFRFEHFNKVEGIQIITDSFMGRNIIVFGSANKGIMGALYTQLKDGTTIEFKSLANGENLILDTNGNEWNVFGKAVSGDLTGAQLERPASLMGFWFAIAIFFPNLQLYE